MLRRFVADLGRPVDGWLALGFVVAAGIEAALRFHHQPGQLAENLTGALIFGCLALRRTRPLLTVSIIAGVFSAGSLIQAVFEPEQSGDAVVPIFALLVVSYSLGAYATRRQLLAGAWQPVVLVLIVDLTEASGNSLVSAAVFITLFISAAPILAGRLVRGRGILVSRLREQATCIQAQHRMQVEAAVAEQRLQMAQRFHRTLVTGMRSLTERVAGAEATSGIAEISEIERVSRELLSQTRTEVVALTVPKAAAHTPPPTREQSRTVVSLRDSAQPWTVLAGGALCAGLLVETRTLPLSAPLPLAWLACLGVALPLALAWMRPLLAIGALWATAALFAEFVAPLQHSFTGIGLSFVSPFVVAALAPRRWALLGLGLCGVGELACFGPEALPSSAAIALCCWIAGAVFYERARLVEQLHANNILLEEQRAAAAHAAVAQERLRIARELHDAVGHSLTVIVLQAGAARRIYACDPARATAVLQTIATVARDGLAELLRGTAPLAPHEGPDLGSVTDVLAAARAAGLRIDAQIDEVAARLAPAARTAVYRLVQEALTNILKHAPGAAATLAIRDCGRHVEVEVANDPQPGQPENPPGNRQGLPSMRARVEACGGRLSWTRSDDGGFAVRAELPVELAVL